MQKTFQCPNCTCLNVLPQVDEDGAHVKCVACKFEIFITKTGKLEHGPIAPNS
jgi:Zn ribbon nucleic-acid-binding protein